MPGISINGRTYDIAAGGTVLDALRAVRVHMPTLCHDDRIAPTGACRLCLVELTGTPKPVPACTTPLEAGMEIRTNTPELVRFRQSLLDMLVRRYPADALARDPDKPFHREVCEHGLAAHAAPRQPGPVQDDGAHPYIAVDMARCIDCYRCVRICAELQGQSVWHVRERGAETRIEPDGPTLLDSSCVSCGACVDTCPTGALDDRSVRLAGPASTWMRTVCPYCGVGCELNVGTRNGAIVSIKPVLTAVVNKGHLCVKGRYAYGFVAAADRVTTPMIREGGTWRSVGWNEARRVVVERLRRVIDRYGPDAVGILGSARATNEDNYVTQKLARAVVGTNNVDCCARVCHAPSAAALKHVLGAGLATNSFDDIEIARTLLVCGANPTESHPVIGARIRQAACRGAHLIVIDPRRTELARLAECHLAVTPGTTIAALNAMAHTIVHERLVDLEFVARRVSDFDRFSAFIDGCGPDRAADVCGVTAEAIRRAARLYATNGPAMCLHGLGLTEQLQGTDGVTALINLALLTGNIGRAGSGINPLRGQNNVQGAAHMGCDPGVLAGSVPFGIGRDAFERGWSVPLPATRGLTMVEMMDAATAGTLKALWTIGYDILMSNADRGATARALGSLDLVIVQDMFLTETAREYGTVFLPACSSFEKDGTFMNAERRIQRVRAALRPIGASKPDWQIVCEMARAMGSPGFAFHNPREIWDEIRAVCDGARGMTYSRLEAGGLQWPCPDEQHPGTSLLHQDAFAMGTRATLQCVEDHGSPELASPLYPFILMTGRSLYQFNAGTMTGRTNNNELRPTDVLDVSPDDARDAHLDDGDLVRVTSRHGSALLPVHVDDGVRRGELFATFQRPDLAVNAVTGPYRDRVTGTPAYKVTAVRLAPASD
jgi:formate dehydrogenase major subunit